MYCVVYCLSLAPVTPLIENIKMLIITTYHMSNLQDDVGDVGVNII